jgi:transposase
MAHFHIKKKKGRPYLYVREIARVGGKPKVISQTYIGPPERVAAMAAGKPKEKILKVEEFGALWLANQMDSDIDLAGIIDDVITPAQREKGPSVGEYFLYCVLNRMVEPKSKNMLADWYRSTAIQHIRPVEIEELSSMRYWEKWNRVSEEELKTIAWRFFRKIWDAEGIDTDCLLFDTTNYYTFMASDTNSELARRGKNKAGRHHLRQIGLGLMVGRKNRLPLYYSVYPGNLHDSKVFHEVMDEMFAVVCGFHKTEGHLTIVIDKGMNSEENYAWIDKHSGIHFVTTYSTYFAEEPARTPFDKFKPVDIAKNRHLIQDGNHEECLLAYRTNAEYWGKQRVVVVTHNPATARKQGYMLDVKLDALKQELLKMRANVRKQLPQWRNPDVILQRYQRVCKRLHVSSDLYHIEFSHDGGRLGMSFHRDSYRIRCKRAVFGRNIIITDNMGWTTAEIVQASLDRWQIEDSFRLSKDEELVSVLPIRHWTDSKIRCHLFTCVVAMTYLRRLELKLQAAGINRTASDVMDDMRHLHSVLSMTDNRSKPKRRLETPTKTQSEILSALGYHIDACGVLHQSQP